MTTLTTRDRELLMRLDKYGFLSTRQVIEMSFAGIRKTTMLRRLRKLEEGEWIRRVQGLSDGSYVWCLGVKGDEEAGAGETLPRINRLNLDHDVRLTDVRLALESIGLGENWVLERAMRQRLYSRRNNDEERSLIPDAIFSAPFHHGQVEAVALELELHAKTLTRYEKIFRRYKLRSKLGMVWYLVESKSFGQRLQEKWHEGMAIGDHADASLGFSLVAEIVKNPRDAKIHFWRAINAVDEFFQLPESAHNSAHGVSTVEANAA